jgi:hypothetical protein
MCIRDSPQSAPPPGGLSFLRAHLREYGILIALVAITAFFQIATGVILLRPVNLTNLVLQNSYIVIMAIGMLLVIVSGHIDLSVGSVMGFVGALAAVMIVPWGLPYPVAALLCLCVGALIGAAQGFWVTYYGIPSFISRWRECWCSRAPRCGCCRAARSGRSRRSSSSSPRASCRTSSAGRKSTCSRWRPGWRSRR